MEFLLLGLVLTAGLVSGDGDVTSTDQVIPSVDVNNAPSYSSWKAGRDMLYYNISVEYYDNAVGIAQELVRNGDKYEIKKAVDSLIEHKRSNIVAFAYKLWAAGEKKIVEDVFPAPFKMVYNDSLIKFTNNKYGIPIAFSRFEDSDGDKNVYGKEYEANSNNYIWRLEPVNEGKDVFFKIRHFSESRYLKLGNEMDSDGDYQAFGSTNSDTERHQWMFQPVTYNGQLSFCIVNRAHWQALKLAVSVYDGNRKVYSTGSDYYNDPERYGWRVAVMTDHKE